jgi:predicted enzyme related to lactoylglutathione lyase
MPEYPPGTPSWVELSTPDPVASAEFYGAVMRWNATEPGPVEETGGYQMFQQDEQRIAGLMRHMQEGQPTAWATYFSVADADDIAAKVKAAGGSVVVDPMDVTDIGRMAFFVDPAGAVFGVWQPKSFAGADLVDEPNSLCWNEVLTRDGQAERAFYPAVFGWTAGRAPFEGAPESYVVWELDGKPVGGMMEMTDEYFPPEVPPHWAVCFAVADCDATVATAREHGATVTTEPMDMPIGRFANLIDPQGASFSVMKLAPAA